MAGKFRRDRRPGIGLDPLLNFGVGTYAIQIKRMSPRQLQKDLKYENLVRRRFFVLQSIVYRYISISRTNICINTHHNVKYHPQGPAIARRIRHDFIAVGIVLKSLRSPVRRRTRGRYLSSGNADGM